MRPPDRLRFPLFFRPHSLRFAIARFIMRVWPRQRAPVVPPFLLPRFQSSEVLAENVADQGGSFSGPIQWWPPRESRFTPYSAPHLSVILVRISHSSGKNFWRMPSSKISTGRPLSDLAAKPMVR